jgi:hypothetical protein
MSPAARVRGRTLMFAGALGFVLLSSLVVWRRGQGIALGRQMRAMQDTLATLGIEQADLAREIRQASDRSRILDAGRKLGLREPADSQVRTLPRASTTDAITDTSMLAEPNAAP